MDLNKSVWSCSDLTPKHEWKGWHSVVQVAGVLQDEPGAERDGGERAPDPGGGGQEPGRRHEEIRPQPHRQILLQGLSRRNSRRQCFLHIHSSLTADPDPAFEVNCCESGSRLFQIKKIVVIGFLSIRNFFFLIPRPALRSIGSKVVSIDSPTLKKGAQTLSWAARYRPQGMRTLKR